MNNLGKIRQASGMDKMELAVRANMSYQGINYLEKKDYLKAQFGSILKIAKVLDIDLNQFKDDVTIRTIEK